MSSYFTILHIICIPILSQVMQVFCDETNEINELRNTLEETFVYDFNNFPKNENILIWKISGNQEQFTPLQYNGECVQFGSKETYLLLTQKCRGLYTVIFYWLGRNTSLIDKQIAAGYAVLLTQFRNAVSMDPFRFQCVYISRETEPIESDSFKNSMQMFNRPEDLCIPNDFFTPDFDINFNSGWPNLYVVLGEEQSRFKKIPLSLGLQWMRKKDSCLILEVGNKVENLLPVYHFCRTEANEKSIFRSSSFALWFRSNYIQKGKDCPKFIHDKHLNDFKQLVEIMENMTFYNPHEVDDSEDHLKNAVDFVSSRDLNISLFDVTMDGLKVNEERPIRNSVFQGHHHMGHLLDTKSVAGIFLVIGYDSVKDIDKQLKAILLAEEYLDKTYSFSTGQILKMRILESLQDPVTDFKVNLSDFPSLIRDMPEGGLW